MTERIRDVVTGAVRALDARAKCRSGRGPR